MRRALTIALATSMTISLTTPANAAAKAGATCTALNATTKVKNQTLKCTKVGKKLMWKVVPTPKPQPTPIPTALSYLEPDALKAFTSVKEVQAASPTGQANISYYQSPNISDAKTDWIKKNLKTGIDFWSPQFIQTKSLPTFFMTEKDKDWFFDKLNTFGFHPDTIIHMTRNWENMVGRGGDRVTWAGVYGQGGGDAFTFYVWGTNAVSTSAGWLQVAPHEWTHSAQNNAAGYLPCWFKEGQATYYGLALAATGEKHFSEIRKEYFSPNDEIDIRKEPTQGWPAWIEDKSQPDADMNCGSNGAYTAGGILTEYMLSLKGHKGITDFFSASKVDGWQKALEKVYETSWSNFKIDAGKYLATVAKVLYK